ncbi:hypothetical protein I551_0738 [Mycobacterium ulcerans str. Harvey]|uniref:Uncharacterized protein n=1 Tax=Mycobacterium ulcerans str. Harvey TaxID=1299332 RepID=A0ABN0R6P7_MYCUL|nr:hypothetical protein I551_0738 [Mycobacterium ulcerans str. Harvey]
MPSSARASPPMTLPTTPPSAMPATRAAGAGADASPACSASAIADTMAAVSQWAGEYQITTDAVRG